MCMTCLQSPCHPRCPNAPEPDGVYTCNHCGEKIIEGEEYFRIDDDYYHDDCLRDNALQVIFDMHTVTRGIAERDDY